MFVYATLQGNRERAIELNCTLEDFERYRDDFVSAEGLLRLDNAYLKRDGISEHGLTLDPEDDSFYLVPFRLTGGT